MSKIKPVARVAVRKTRARAKVKTESPRPRAVAEKRKPPAAGGRSLPSSAQPSHEELLHFFNESSDLLCIAGFDGRFKRLNPAWQPALGWTLKELQARPFLDIVHANDRPATLAEMEKLATGARTITFENRYHCKDGSWKWLQWTASPMPGREEIYAIARDVTLQKHLEKEILETLDCERARVGRDLHDSLGPQFAAIGYAATFLANDLRRRKQPEAARAEQIRGMSDDAMSLAQNLARGIFPAQMDGVDLPLALEDLARTSSSLRGMSVSFHKTGDPHVNHPDDGRHLYQIVQEAVNNAARHGGAKNVTIILSGSEDSLRLAVADDGKGMALPSNHTRGMGLHSMRYRARILGGDLKIDSHPSEGTIISCEIPNGPRQPATPAPLTRSPVAEKKKILIIEDHPVFRAMLVQLVEEELGMTVCGQADNIQEAMTLLEGTRPDAAIVDLTLRGSSGLELIKDLKARHNHLPVLVLSMHAERLYAERVLRAGAKGYISKQEEPADVVEAIREVMNGQTYVSKRVNREILGRLGHADKAVRPSGIDLLSDREIEVFQLIGRGLNSRQVSKRLHLRPSTVDSYRARIKEKLGIKNAAELYQRAAQWAESNP